MNKYEKFAIYLDWKRDIKTFKDYKKMLEKSVGKANDKSLFVIEGINKSKETKAFWKEIVSSEQFPTTFDLYYCGIIFFDQKRYKENYIVNF